MTYMAGQGLVKGWSRAGQWLVMAGQWLVMAGQWLVMAGQWLVMAVNG